MRRIVRDLIGYGVVSGLHVTPVAAIDERGPRLQVGPGGLVTPSGQLVCISPAQCAYLNDWLKANRSAIDAISVPPPPELELAVVACYRECQTDDVPIPGEPCRSEDELMKPSRIAGLLRARAALRGAAAGRGRRAAQVRRLGPSDAGRRSGPR